MTPCEQRLRSGQGADGAFGARCSHRREEDEHIVAKEHELVGVDGVAVITALTVLNHTITTADRLTSVAVVRGVIVAVVAALSRTDHAVAAARLKAARQARVTVDLVAVIASLKADLTVDEAIDLGRRAIYHATHRDAYSGGINNLYHVTKDGWKVVHAIDVNDMHYEFQEEKKAAMS